jgi:predicted outer membrane protein
MIKTLRGYMFYGKPLRLNFSQRDSDFIAKLKGTFDEALVKKRESIHQEEAKIREVKARRKIINKLLKLRQQTGAPVVQGQPVKMGDQLHAPIGFMYESLQPLT